MSSKYRPQRYKKNRPIAEKIIFSAPEYIVYETRLGGWIVVQLQRMLATMNEFSIKFISGTTDNFQRKLVKFLTDLISRLLDWMNYFVERRERDSRRKRRKR